MKEDVIAANLANLRQSVNELKKTVNNLNEAYKNHAQTTQSAVDEQTICNSVEKSFYNCWNDAVICGKEIYLEATAGYITVFTMASETH